MGSRLSHLECARCAQTHDADRLQNRCGCGGTLLARYDLAGISLKEVRGRPPGMWRYEELLPVKEDRVVLGEPRTPLLFLPRLSERWGTAAFMKDDSFLPGSTFKARGAAAGLSRAVELGATRLVMPSAGNAGGAWSLYAARAGIPITVTMARTAPEMNQHEVRLAGGSLILVDGTIADAAAEAKRIADETGAFLSSTFNEPYRLEGKKSAWLEVFDQLGDEDDMDMPATVIVSVGGGVAALAVAKATDEIIQLGWASGPGPKIVGVQAADCAPITEAFDSGATEVEPWPEEPTTIAAGLRVPVPSEGDLVLDRIRASKGSMLAATEEEIAAGVADLASTEGVFASPEGATTVVAAGKLAERGELEGPVVLYNTAAGAKYL